MFPTNIKLGLLQFGIPNLKPPTKTVTTYQKKKTNRRTSTKEKRKEKSIKIKRKKLEDLRRKIKRERVLTLFFLGKGKSPAFGAKETEALVIESVTMIEELKSK